MDTRNQDKFMEPRGWAMKWVLTPAPTHPATGQEQGNLSETWEKFAEPRGWAVKWDGFALPGAGEEQNVPASTQPKS
ncbi:MAG: hypothetical protein SXV54_16095 [Chloroflexota bacterium]|nr:hypothetical protein [Chloroflexota bacterium]